MYDVLQKNPPAYTCNVFQTRFTLRKRIRFQFADVHYYMYNQDIHIVLHNKLMKMARENEAICRLMGSLNGQNINIYKSIRFILLNAYCMCVRVRACARVRVRACVRACMCVYYYRLLNFNIFCYIISLFHLFLLVLCRF